jgi:two-component system alkaline phosphatase synthesis response regulator PhoP
VKVLVIEDEAANVDLLSTRLRKLDCSVLVAQNVEDALRLARDEHPNLILLDLKLGPTLASGVQLLAELRGTPETAHLPVIIHSIYVSRPGDMPEAEALADGHLLKPFKFDDLQKIIAAFQPMPEAR